MKTVRRSSGESTSGLVARSLITVSFALSLAVVATATDGAEPTSLRTPPATAFRPVEVPSIATVAPSGSPYAEFPSEVPSFATRAPQPAPAAESERKPQPEPTTSSAGRPTRAEVKAWARARLGDDRQFGCLDRLWQRESAWRWNAHNESSGAYGIPQALPGSKMATAGDDWRTNPITQVKWGLRYIERRYGSPCGAWAHSESHGWY